MNQKEFVSGLRKSLCDGGCPEQPPSCYDHCPPAMDKADAVIACPEVQQLYVRVIDMEPHNNEDGTIGQHPVERFVPLADWLKEEHGR